MSGQVIASMDSTATDSAGTPSWSIKSGTAVTTITRSRAAGAGASRLAGLGNWLTGRH